MQPDPHRLLVLRAVQRTGSIQAAARALHLAPSGVSQHIARLEEETGLVLLDRTRRGGGRTVALSSEGTAIAARADLVADALAGVEREAGRLRDKAMGTVRVGGFAGVLHQLVVPVITDLTITDPAIEPHVFEVEHDAGVGDLRAGKLDLLLSERDPDAPTNQYPGVVERDLLRDPYKIVVPSVWTTPDTPDQLLAGTWVAPPSRHPSRRNLDRLCARQGTVADDRHNCTDSRTMLALVAAGFGAALIPDMTLSYLPTAGVRTSAVALDPGARVITVLHRSASQPNSTAAERFRSHLHTLAGDRGLSI